MDVSLTFPHTKASLGKEQELVQVISFVISLAVTNPQFINGSEKKQIPIVFKSAQRTQVAGLQDFTFSFFLKKLTLFVLDELFYYTSKK